MKTSLWHQLARPTYLISPGPWVGLFALIWPLVLWSVAFAVILGSALGVLLAFSYFSQVISAYFTILTLIWLLITPVLVVASMPLFGLWFGATERERLRLMGFPGVSNPHVPMRLRPFKNWLKFRYLEPATWREVLFTVISGFFSIGSSIVLFSEMAWVSLCSYAVWILGIEGRALSEESIFLSYLNHPEGSVAPAHASTIPPSNWWQFALALGLSVIVFAYLNGLIAAASGSMSKALLAPRPEEIQRQVDRLTFSRATIMESFESERKRIERDLHDGVQQELVNLSLRLGMAEMEVTSLKSSGVETQQAELHLRLAQEQTSHALHTLRNTVLGIYPAVLEDHGLHAALEELANNCLLPTQLSYAASPRPAPEVERTAYYAVNEAMANALKHSTASRLWITARSVEGHLTIQVRDNGQGGADPTRGTGISGLKERARTLGGSVWVESPLGGPTTLYLRLPLGETHHDPLTPWSAADPRHTPVSKG